MNRRRRAVEAVAGALVWTLGAAWLTACGAAGAPLAPGPGAPLAPATVEARRAPKGWELRVTPPRVDTDGSPLPEPVRVAVFDADAACLGLPLVEGPPEKALRLPPSAGRYDVAAWSGRQFGEPRRVDLPAWTPPPPAPEAPLLFRRADGAVELSWLPPSDPAAQVVVERDGRELGRFPASVATLADPVDPAEARPPRYRLAVVGADYRTAWSAAVTAP